MKMKSAGTLPVLPPLILAFGALLLTAPARACTVFCYSQGNSVLAGRSFDVPDDPGFGLLFVPAAAGTHGWVCGGRFSGPCADGMNDQGLFAAVADVPVPASHTTTSSRRPASIQTFITSLLANCASVDEAINWCRKLPTPTLYGQVHQDFLGYYTFDTPGHFLIADRSGDSAVLEWYRGKLNVVRKHGRYQLMTNFLLTDPAAGSYPCPRYLADTGVFDQATGPGLETCRQVLDTTAQGITRYSLLCDLANGDVHV
jgi:choloylglycine hydrolase